MNKKIRALLCGALAFTAMSSLVGCTGSEKDAQASELNWTTQWKWNAGKHISPDTRLYLGVEHSVWNNKFGLKNQDENNVSALVKYHF